MTDATIEALRNGPLKVSGASKVTDARGETTDADGDLFLCRCGHSGNKPFCDGSHTGAGFKDPE